MGFRFFYFWNNFFSFIKKPFDLKKDRSYLIRIVNTRKMFEPGFRRKEEVPFAALPCRKKRTARVEVRGGRETSKIFCQCFR